MSPQRRFTSQRPMKHSTSPAAFASDSFSRNTSTPIASSSAAAADCVPSAPIFSRVPAFLTERP